MDIRGGATTADHIDILGSSALNEILLKVAAGDSDDVDDHFVSVRAVLGALCCDIALNDRSIRIFENTHKRSSGIRIFTSKIRSKPL